MVSATISCICPCLRRPATSAPFCCSDSLLGQCFVPHVPSSAVAHASCQLLPGISLRAQGSDHGRMGLLSAFSCGDLGLSVILKEQETVSWGHFMQNRRCVLCTGLGTVRSCQMPPSPRVGLPDRVEKGRPCCLRVLRLLPPTRDQVKKPELGHNPEGRP